MSVKDVIKSGVLESLGGGGNLELPEICLILVISCLIGIYIYAIYKNVSKSAFYSKDLGITMAGMTIVVAAIMIAMQSNLLVSLGMVGALSIVRFRTAIKNPIDLLYLFWSISGGIIAGVGLYALAVVLCFVMTAIIILLSKVRNSKAPAVLIIRGEMTEDNLAIESVIKSYARYYHLCSSSIKNKQTELIYEVNTIDKTELVKEVEEIAGVVSVSCLEHDGEIRA